MFSWGENCQRGFCLKGGSNIDSTTEDGIHYLNVSYQIRDLSAGYSVLAFVKSKGEAFIVRTNESKDGRRVRGKPKFVKCKEKIQAVSCGDDVATLLSERGTLFCMDTTHPSFTSRPLEALCNIPVSQVACGSQHSVALTKDGQVYTWGKDSRGQLGLGKRKACAMSPQHLRSLSVIPLVQIAAGGEQSFALSVSGGVFGWGRNDCGQLGLGDTTDRKTPTPVHYLNMKKTIHISCGTDHTAILTKDGAVFTFGSGQYGQLGHNSFCYELRPRLVAELWGAKVAKIACGRHHTLVLTVSTRVYSFGCEEQGQLGHGEKSHPSLPLRVQLLKETSDGPKIRNIYAGGNCSFATCMSNEDIHQGFNTDTINNVTQQSIDCMIDRWTSECVSKSWKKKKQMFSSASCLNKSFLDQSKDKHFLTTPKYSGLNLSLAKLNFEKLVKNDDVLTEVETAVLQLLPSLDERPVGVEGLRIFLLLNELLHVIQKHKQGQNTKLAEAVATALLRLSAESLQVIVDWWSSLTPSTMVKYVKVWKQALSVILSFGPISRNSTVNSGIKSLLQVLQHMYNANNRIAGRQRVPEKTYRLGINQEILKEDLQLWRSTSKNKDMNYQPLILCKFPFLMDLKSKKMAFDINAACTQREHQINFPGPCGWLPKPGSDFFELSLKRPSLLEDTFKQLAAAHHSAFKKPIVVYFDEDPNVTDVYKRDFFHHLFHDIVSTKSDMFMFNDSKTLAWFPSKAKEEDKTNFFLFGVLCGLALYNQSIIYLPFPLALFKKLLGVKPTLEDMMEFSPCVGKSLLYALDYKGDLEDLDMCFMINWDETEVDLDPQNPGKPLTSQNRKEFVDAYVTHVFNTSVESVFQEFKRGFFLVCDLDLVKLFRPEELQGVLVGNDVYDWAKLKQNTVYNWQYYIDHPTIQMFWEVFDELTEEQKKDFLLFLTGFRRVPILGMYQIQMKVRVKIIQSGSYDQHFPESLTCHSILELPLYSTKDIMRDRLTEALIPDRGFLM
ncbi:probable E3 ubiquitin-protein ligase HERC3 isoform X2 [Xiphias gladius]|uniref:probable E3 ubiquitin-protein ligase HERC3 isoform X2 n=1 Tax=Xiphias gladius TaxID=8245 RepID=UPI001A997A94|nr:probable E3 ubiquitin-protein ligase HERC3 isoform X2 [Xiphias gladius]